MLEFASVPFAVTLFGLNMSRFGMKRLSLDWLCCAPEGGLFEVDGVNICGFCQAQNADDHYLEIHYYLQCRDKAHALLYQRPPRTTAPPGA